MKACMFRLHFFTKNYKDKKSNYAYRIENEKYILDDNNKNF